MKRRIKITGDLFKTNMIKTIAVLAVFVATNTSIVSAQERSRQHTGSENQPRTSRQQNWGRTQATLPNRQQPTGTATNRTAPINNGNRTYRTVNPGTTRSNNAGQFNTGRTIQNTNRSTTINNTRTNVRVVNRSNTYRPTYSANNPSWHYANLPRRNSVITTIPATYRTINYGGYNYRYNNGVFYRPYNNTFRVIAPPVGIFINVLPFGYRRIMVNDYPYYYYNGTYYDYRDNNYLVVSPPVGAIVESLPAGYETVTIDGETYYTVDGAQYKPVVQENGEVWYEVIKAN